MGYPPLPNESGRPDLNYKSRLSRNINSRILTFTSGLFAAISVLPLFLVLTYVLIKGGSKLSIHCFSKHRRLRDWMEAESEVPWWGR